MCRNKSLLSTQVVGTMWGDQLMIIKEMCLIQITWNS